MSKGPWKKKEIKSGFKIPPPEASPNGKSAVQKPAGTPFQAPPVPNASDRPQPLPPMTTASPGPMPAPGAPSGPLTPKMALPTDTPEGLGQLFVSSTKSIENIINGSLRLSGANLEIEIAAIEEGEAKIWGTFALPVFEKYLSRFKESPEYALLTVTVLIIGGKIKTKTKAVIHDGRKSETENGGSSTSGDLS